MGSSPGGREVDGSEAAFSEAEIREQLQRILSSSCLIYSPRLRRFLSYLVDRALSGDRAPNEYSIGVDVFDRDSRFDPRIDPIVRVYARRLRAKLKEYYATVGIDDRMEIALPPRSYVPTFRARPAAERATRRNSSVRAESDPPETVVLFPFTALSLVPEDQHFADGLTEELLHALAQLKGVRIVAAEAIRPGNRRPEFNDRDIGDHVIGALWGAIRRAGGEFRISVELVSVADRSVLWSGMYQPEVTDAVSVQQMVAAEVCESVRQRLHGESRPNSDSESKARRLLMKAHHSGGRSSRASIHASVHYLVEAVNADPDYAHGHAALAEAYAIMALYAEHPPRDAMAKARSHAFTALELDPWLAEGHVGLGIVAGLHDRDLTTARHEFSRALDLQPRSPAALHWHALAHLAIARQFEPAIRALERARELDPTSLAIRAVLGYVLTAAGRPADALAAVLAPSDDDLDTPELHWSAGVAHLTAGQVESAIGEFEIASRQSGDLSYARASLAHALAVAGRRAQAERLLDELESKARASYVPSVHLALIRLGLQDEDGALAHLANSRDEGCPWFALARIDPRFQSARIMAAFHSAFR